MEIVRPYCVQPGDPAALLGLSGGMVDFEDVQLLGPTGTPPGECVETGAENDVLSHSGLDRLSKFLFRIRRPA